MSDLMKQDFKLSTFLGLKRDGDGNLMMPNSENVHNHIETIHAGAQFCLAELATGTFVEQEFMEFKGKIFIVLRRTDTKYSAAGRSDLTAYTEIDKAEFEAHREAILSGKGALVWVKVTVKDTQNVMTFMGKFLWYLKMI